MKTKPQDLYNAGNFFDSVSLYEVGPYPMEIVPQSSTAPAVQPHKLTQHSSYGTSTHFTSNTTHLYSLSALKSVKHFYQ
jgi:hypothetical protein